MPMTKLVEIRKKIAIYLTRPILHLLVKTSVTPNTITWFGFLLSVVAAALIATGSLLVAGILVLVAGLFDLLDGALARRTKQTTNFGAILDSTLDRLAETVILLGVLILYARAQSIVGIMLASIAIPSSLLVSYIKAKAEVLNIECEVGIFTRTERVIVLALGLSLSQIDYALFTALGIIILFSLFTVGQRLLHARQQMKSG